MDSPATIGKDLAIFFDRDGVLNTDHGYVYRVSDWEWIEGALEALHLAKECGWRVIVVTNQSGIARGYYSEAQMLDLHRWVQVSCGGTIDAFYHCPHGPDAGCRCRKPEPGLLLQAANDFNLDLGRCHLIGDKDSDVAAARAAGVPATQFFGGSLLAVVKTILGLT